MAGRSFRWARSPVAPKMVKIEGSAAPPTRRPTRRGVSAAGRCATWESDAASCRAELRGTAGADAGQSSGYRLQQRVERLREGLDAFDLELAGHVVEVDALFRKLVQHRPGLVDVPVDRALHPPVVLERLDRLVGHRVHG